MKKNKKILIIVGIAVVLLVGLMLLLIFLPKGTTSSDPNDSIDEGISMSTTTDENGVHQATIKTDKDGKIENNSYGTLLEYVPAKISTIHIENTAGTLDIKSETPTKSDGTTEETVYTLVGYEDYEMQAGTPDDIANDAAALSFSEVVTLDKDKASEFGFDKPTATATVTYTDKTKAVIQVGNDAPQGAGTYVKFGDGDAIYLVATDAVDSFSYGLTDLMSLTINDSASNTDNSQASSIEISGTNFKNTIELKPNTNENYSATYVITKPTSGFASETESSNVDGAIRGLYADSVAMVAPSSSQLKELGLSSPYARIKAVYPDTTVEILTSKPDGEGNVYLMEKDGKVVYKKASANLPWVLTSYEKLVNEYVLYPKFASISEMSVNNGSNRYDYSLSSKEVTTTDDDGVETTSTTTTVKLGDKEIELSYFSTFFQNISLTKLADVTSESVSGTPVFSVSYVYTDNSSDTVNFYSASNNRYAAEVNGKVIGHVYQSGINKLVKQATTISENKEVDALT